MQDYNILFISYDGMTDPLGQSQVLPYLKGLSEKGYHITLLSCEKSERYKINQDIIRKIVQESNIDWRPITFTKTPPILAKFYDIMRLQKQAQTIVKEKDITLVHCRSYVSASVGLMLKKKLGVKLLFDMRGFWVDERVDGGLWNLKNPLYRYAYRQYKKKEAAYIRNSDGIVSLTQAGKREIESWPSYTKAPITVIPCSADFQHFELATKERKRDARAMLGLHEEDLVISYLGSIGLWYMLEEMLQLFSHIKKKYPHAKFLFITPDPATEIYSTASQYGLKQEDFVVRFATRKEVPLFTSASDFNLFFIKQTYSKIASSPTKLGEILAMGIPVICNSKVGDVKEIVEAADAGVVIDEFSMASYDTVLDKIPALLQKRPEEIRAMAIEYYNLSSAIEKYNTVYKQIIG